MDWDTTNWPASSVATQNFNNDAGNPGNDVTIAISGNTGGIFNPNPDNSPDDNTRLNGGDGQKSLLLAVNQGSNANSITVTITFNYTTGVDNISFTIFDVDQNGGGTDVGFVDQLRNISASDGTNTYAVSLSNTGSTTNTIANNNTLTATATGTSGATDGSTQGDVVLTFSGQPMSSITFTYGNGAGAPANPGQQGIGLGDITYTVAPEPSTWLTAVLLSGLALFIHTQQRRHPTLTPLRQ